MNNKRIFWMLALALVMACAIGLVACNNDNGDDGDGGDGTYQQLVIVDEDGNWSTAYTLPDVVYGYGPNFGSLRLCYRDPNGTMTEVKDDDTGISVSYTHNTQALDEAPTVWQLGNYTITYSNYVSDVTIFFRVVTSAVSSQYSFDISKTMWEYLSEMPTVTVKNRGEVVDEEDYSIRFVKEADYAAIRDAEDFSNTLAQKSQDYTHVSELKPGVYYLYAQVRDYNSTFQRVTVTKATPTFENLELLFAEEYRYSTMNDVIGSIQLSQIRINRYESDTYNRFAMAVGADGNQVYGEFEWQNPTLSVNCNMDNTAHYVKFVPSDTDCFNVVNNVVAVNITVTPGYIILPKAQEYQSQYNGYEYPVRLGAGTDTYPTFVTVLKDNEEMSLSTEYGEALVEKVINAGTYAYTLKLKDSVNFYWVDIDDYDERYTPTKKLKADQSYEYVVRKASSGVAFGPSDLPQLVPDKNGQIKFEIGCFATPHQLGTLSAEYSENNGFTISSECVARVEVVVEDGKEYIVIDNIQGASEVTSSRLYVHFTAVSDPNYEPLDEINREYYFEIHLTPRAYVNQQLATYVGFVPYRLYKEFPTTRSTAGDWQMYLELNNDWQLVTEQTKLDTVGEFNFKLVFDHSNILDQYIPDDWTFTITTEAIPEYIIEAGATYEVPDTEYIVPYIRQQYNLNLAQEGENGWELQVLREGKWDRLSNYSSLIAGEYQVRLVYTKHYHPGWDFQPDFGVEFTVVVTSQND